MEVRPISGSDQEQYRRFVEKLELEYFFYRHDLAGVFTYVSPSLTRVLGYTSEEFQRHYTSYLTDNPINREVVRHSDLSIQGIQQPPYIVEIRHRNGSVRLLEVAEYPVRNDRGNVVAVEGVAQDVTERMKSGEAIRQSEERFRVIFEHLGDAAFLADVETGRILDANRSAEIMMGRPRSEIVGMHQAELHPPERREEFRRMFAEHIQLEHSPKASADVIRADGSLLPVEISASTMMQAGRNTILGLFRDVTERHRAEEELKLRYESEQLARRAAEAAAKARDAFLLVAAHDLKTPLGALSIQIDGMRRLDAAQGLTQPVITKGLELIERQSERLISLVQGLLELARIRGGKLDLVKNRCDLAEIVRSVSERYAPLLEKSHCTLDRALGPDATGFWDRERLERVVENLLSNAVKFGAGQPIRVEVVAHADRIRLTVSDQGLGIPADQQELIFDQFERGSSSPHFGGMGMGLYIVREIVEAHDGAIRVTSSPSNGASFIVELPRQV